MKLFGNKSTSIFLTLAAGTIQASDISAELTTFTAGTPAKAAEVNTNFTELKNYSDSLQDLISSQASLISNLEAKVTALENQSGDDFTIPVNGDGELIGYTNLIPIPSVDATIIVKTTLGKVKLKGGYENNYVLDYYNETRPGSEGWGSAYYADSNCTIKVNAISPSEGSPLLFSKVAGILDQSYLLASAENTSYVMEAGSSISSTDTVYEINYEDVCSLIDWMPAGTKIIPIVELNPETHGLNDNFTTISIDGYILN